MSHGSISPGLASDKNRKILAFLGGGISAVAIAVWTVTTHLSETKSPNPPNINASPSVTVAPTTAPNINTSPSATVAPTINNNPSINVTTPVTVAPTINNNPSINVTTLSAPRGQIKVTYDVCMGDHEDRCPPHNAFIRCTADGLATWAKKECAKYITKRISEVPGGMCGYAVYRVECTANE